MFANAFQSGFISIFYSVGSSPLSIWNKEVKNGHIRRVVDEEVKSLVLEIAGTNVATTYITCPQKPRVSLAIKLPFLVMIIKNMKKYFTFEIQILDDKDIRRRFRVSNFQSTTKVRPFCTTMPIGLSDGWNQVQFNLADFTKRAYGSTYLETVRVQIHANVRIRRIYFSDTLYNEEEMPNEFRLFLPKTATRPKPKEKGKLEKKAPVKAAAVEEVPFGAPPSPVETTVPQDEGPLPTAKAEEEQAEVPKTEEQEAKRSIQEEAITELAPPSDGSALEEERKEEASEGAQESEAPPEGEVVQESENLPEGDVPPVEDVQQEPVPEVTSEGVESTKEEGIPPENESSEPAPVEEATKEE